METAYHLTATWLPNGRNGDPIEGLTGWLHANSVFVDLYWWLGPSVFGNKRARITNETKNSYWWSRWVHLRLVLQKRQIPFHLQSSRNSQQWKSLDLNVLGEIHQPRSTRRLYDVDRVFHQSFSVDNGETWFTIEMKEWWLQLTDLVKLKMSKMSRSHSHVGGEHMEKAFSIICLKHDWQWN